jgi:hypothetical protein
MAITVPAAASEPSSTDRSSIVVAREAGTVVVTVRGELDTERSRHLGIVLADLIDGQGNMSILVDLHDAGATDPDCLWMLTEAAERAHRRGGAMRVDPAAGLELRGLDEFVCRSAGAG